MNATELLELTLTLKIVLWIEFIVYMGIGLYEIFDSFADAKPWVKKDGKSNSYLFMKETVSYKMHASVCFLLGFIELELIFVSLALIMMLLWMTILPGRLGFNILFLTKPETTLQIVMLIFFWDLIRIEILVLCVSLNLWGFIVYFFHTRKKAISPYKYETIRNDAKDAGVERKTLAVFDKLAGK